MQIQDEVGLDFLLYDRMRGNVTGSVMWVLTSYVGRQTPECCYCVIQTFEKIWADVVSLEDYKDEQSLVLIETTAYVSYEL